LNIEAVHHQRDEREKQHEELQTAERRSIQHGTDIQPRLARRHRRPGFCWDSRHGSARPRALPEKFTSPPRLILLPPAGVPGACFILYLKQF
jgi:hypothetical protein